MILTGLGHRQAQNARGADRVAPGRAAQPQQNLCLQGRAKKVRHLT